VADELCSRATVIQVMMDGRVALGQTIEMSLLRSVNEGTVTFTGRARHRGTTSWVWDVEAIDERDRLCALGRVTIAVREFEQR
jgi:1,4-dihydroxy-2-naphthoyl-CoA hydrolase